LTVRKVIREHGLAATLAFGGRPVVGAGFGMPLILRYVLEFCRSIDEAIAVLARVPSHMAYTIGLLDRAGAHATVFVSPDRPARVVDARVSTNHQEQVEWPEYAALTRTEDRAAFLEDLASRADTTPDEIIRQFTRPPIVSRNWKQAFGTLYTAAYRPRDGQVEYRWPHGSWEQSFEAFVEGEAVISYPGAASGPGGGLRLGPVDTAD
jgi:predicted choloylglycine hydrolase